MVSEGRTKGPAYLLLDSFETAGFFREQGDGVPFGIEDLVDAQSAL